MLGLFLYFVREKYVNKDKQDSGLVVVLCPKSWPRDRKNCLLATKTPKTNFICMLSPWLFSPVKINVSLNLCSFKLLMADEIITTS